MYADHALLSDSSIVESMGNITGKLYRKDGDVRGRANVADLNYWTAPHKSRFTGYNYTRAFGFSPSPLPRELGTLLAECPSAYSTASNSFLATERYGSTSNAQSKSHGDDKGGTKHATSIAERSSTGADYESAHGGSYTRGGTAVSEGDNSRDQDHAWRDWTWNRNNESGWKYGQRGQWDDRTRSDGSDKFVFPMHSKPRPRSGVAPSEVATAIAPSELPNEEPDPTATKSPDPNKHEDLTPAEEEVVSEVLSIIGVTERPQYRTQCELLIDQEAIEAIIQYLDNEWDFSLDGSCRVASFDISDLPLMHSLGRLADRAPHGKYVFLLVDAGQLKEITNTRPRVKEALDALRSLPSLMFKESKGRSSSIAGRMHVKFCGGRRRMWVGSSNLTRAARIRNNELTMQIDEPRAVA